MGKDHKRPRGPRKAFYSASKPKQSQSAYELKSDLHKYVRKFEGSMKFSGGSSLDWMMHKKLMMGAFVVKGVLDRVKLEPNENPTTDGWNNEVRFVQVAPSRQVLVEDMLATLTQDIDTVRDRCS